MDRFTKANAARSVDGYYLPAPHEISLGKQEEAFNRAKQELIMHMKNKLEYVESLEYEDFKSLRKRNFR